MQSSHHTNKLLKEHTSLYSDEGYDAVHNERHLTVLDEQVASRSELLKEVVSDPTNTHDFDHFAEIMRKMHIAGASTEEIMSVKISSYEIMTPDPYDEAELLAYEAERQAREEELFAREFWQPSVVEIDCSDTDTKSGRSFVSQGHEEVEITRAVFKTGGTKADWRGHSSSKKTELAVTRWDVSGSDTNSDDERLGLPRNQTTADCHAPFEFSDGYESDNELSD